MIKRSKLKRLAGENKIGIHFEQRLNASHVKVKSSKISDLFYDNEISFFGF